MSRICPNRRGAKRKEWTTYMFVATTLLYSLAFPQKMLATLIIAVRHNDEMCLASDSLLSNQHQQPSGKYIKCFQSSDTSCVAISGFGGADITIGTNSYPTTINVRFPQELEQIASEESAKHLPFLQSASNV